MAARDQQGRERVDGLVSRLTIIASFAGGASVGVLVGHGLSVRLTVDEFGVLGNWVAGLGTLGALFLAYIVHRRDVSAREEDRELEDIREFNRRSDEAERVKAHDHLQRRNAERVQASIAVGGSYAGHGDSRYVSSVIISVVNRSSEPIADVSLTTRWPDIKKSWLEVLPRDTKSERIPVLTDIELPRDKSEEQEFMQEKLELRFRMYDRLWRWTPEAGVREHSDGQEVAATATSAS